MVSERMRRNLDAYLDAAEGASHARDWSAVAENARAALAIEADNADALTFLRMAETNLGTTAATSTPTPATPDPPTRAPSPQPESFAAGRYHVRRFLGEGGKKRVFLAHDETLDRDVAFALIKTEGLDATGRERIVREAQAMGRLGAHPHVVTIFEIGEEAGAPYVVTELMGGGDVEGMLKDGPLPLARTIEIAQDICRGLVFAHTKGVVHRDLKPGNVWLTDTGVAKIGDFGLAVALDRSRLTQHGMMVGTVAYMPPEQALGGEVTAQSDLYSLGAMLYELVTGKPPFQADDPTAVISQHINTPPVAPSWNSEHCPPDLETLILRLLAKVPADRPGSAAEVLAALERVDPNVESASHSNSQVNPLDRLARGVFVGRERELTRLRSAFDEAFAGHGSVVMLVGEPGIGKTRTVQELETYARLRGAAVCWGRANETAGAPPYWPWVQVARAYRAQNADEVRRREYGPFAAELQRILPALRDLFPGLPELPATESDEGQFRLFDAMSGFLHGVSERTAIMVVLDDLHWADRATLLMLAHLARDLARARILVLGTYRDTDLDRRHPLSQALAEMNREDLFLRIPLRGLDEGDVRDYIARAAGVEPSRELARRVFEETEGNPFFLSEVVRLMTEEGTIRATSISDVALPEGVKQALGRRLDRLSDEANLLLSTLAVVGRECDHALVQALSEHDADTTLRLLEEALRARVLEEAGTGQYRFTHALMQETLLGELSAARQVQLHGRIAQALETLYGEGADTLAAVALHYRESAVLNREHAAKAAHFAWLAGQQAASRFAWLEAATWWRACLAQLEGAGQAGSVSIDIAELLLDLGTACRNVAEWRDAWRYLMRAVDAFRRRGDRIGFARAVEETNGVNVPVGRLTGLLEEAAKGVQGRDPVLWALLVGRLLESGAMDADYDATHERALAIALDQHSVAAEQRLVRADANRALRSFDLGAALAARIRERELAEQTGIVVGSGPGSEAWILAARGEIDDALAAAHRSLQTAERRGIRLERDTALNSIGFIALNRGQLDEIDAIAEDLRTSSSAMTRDVYALRLLIGGEPTRAVEALPPIEMLGGVQSFIAAVHGTRAHVLAAADKKRESTIEIGGWRDFIERMGYFGQASLPFNGVGLLQGLSGPPVSLLDTADARWLYHAIAQPPFAAVQAGISVFRGINTLRGELALRFDELDRAERWFRHGVEFGRKWELMLEVGCCLQGLAEVAERRGNHLEAMQHLVTAGEIYAKHGVKLYLDQVLAKKQLLRA